MSADRHLVLIGLMGSGKTTVGERCARVLGRRFIDTDAIVEANTGATIPEIFAREGEVAFRAREGAAVADALASPDALVIACGGGAMVDAENRRAVRSRGFVVWLQAAPDVLAARVERDGLDGRPLLANGPTTATITRLADARAHGYAAAADVSVRTEGNDPDAVAAEVLTAFAETSG